MEGQQQLLEIIRRLFKDRPFDTSSIIGEAAFSPELLAALRLQFPLPTKISSSGATAFWQRSQVVYPQVRARENGLAALHNR